MKSRLNILFLVSGFPTKENPARCIFNWRAAELLGVKHNVTVVFFRYWRPGRNLLKKHKAKGFELWVLTLPAIPSLPNSYIWSFTRLTSILIKNRIASTDIIQSVGAYPMGLIGSYLSKRHGKTHVGQLIGSDVNSVLPQVKNRYMIRGWEKNIHGISGNSAAILEAFRKLYPDVAVPSIVNYRGVDVSRFPETHEEFNETIFLFLGGLPDYPDLPYRENTKGGQSLMRIWKDFEKSIPKDSNVKLLFGGPGSNKPEVEQWHRGLMYPEKVEVLGNISPDEVAGLMSGAKLVLIPSKEEGTPNVGFEALGSGTAIMGSDVGGVPELVEEGKNGWILPANDEDKWTQTLQTVIQEETDLMAMGKRSRDLAKEKFDHRLFEKRLTQLYHKLLNN